MELDLRFADRAASIEITDPFHLDLESITARVRSLLTEQGASMEGLDMAGLLPLMVRGVAGCENGCPANAKDLVERGYGSFTLEYVEGGILMAQAETGDGRMLMLKLFPEF